MARKKKHDEHENHERWLVSYADFITLLFAFFTSMYAISSVNEGKFRILSDSLAIAFNPSLYTTTKVNEGPRFVRDDKPHISSEFKDMFASNYQKVVSALQKFDKDKRLTLLVEDQNIVIRMQESMVFRPGTDELADEGLPVLHEIGMVLKDLPNSVRIEGHTDDVPIQTERFPSNWDLSAARSLKILKHFVETAKYDPRKLSAVGYGEYRPVASNDTPSGRARNRRVDILIVNIERSGP